MQTSIPLILGFLVVVIIKVEVATSVVVVVVVVVVVAAVVEARSNVKCVLSTITMLSHVTTDSILSIRPPTIATMAMIIIRTDLNQNQNWNNSSSSNWHSQQQNQNWNNSSSSNWNSQQQNINSGILLVSRFWSFISCDQQFSEYSAKLTF